MTARRLDQAMVEDGLAPSRARARDMILRGTVRVGGKPVTKPAAPIEPGTPITTDDPARDYVSRSAVKLLGAIDHFHLDPTGARALDLGASTGGFTQVLLERGAAQVLAIDVGHGQFAPRLAADPRVSVREGLNARDLTAADLPFTPNWIVCDVSFIPLHLALGPALSLAAPGARLVALVKPQFEVGKAHVGKGGIVRDTTAIEAAVARVITWIEAEGWAVEGQCAAAIEGGDGNREVLVVARKRD